MNYNYIYNYHPNHPKSITILFHHSYWIIIVDWIVGIDYRLQSNHPKSKTVNYTSISIIPIILNLRLNNLISN